MLKVQEESSEYAFRNNHGEINDGMDEGEINSELALSISESELTISPQTRLLLLSLNSLALSALSLPLSCPHRSLAISLLHSLLNQPALDWIDYSLWTAFPLLLSQRVRRLTSSSSFPSTTTTGTSSTTSVSLSPISVPFNERKQMEIEEKDDDQSDGVENSQAITQVIQMEEETTVKVLNTDTAMFTANSSETRDTKKPFHPNLEDISSITSMIICLLSSSPSSSTNLSSLSSSSSSSSYVLFRPLIPVLPILLDDDRFIGRKSQLYLLELLIYDSLNSSHSHQEEMVSSLLRMAFSQYSLTSFSNHTVQRKENMNDIQSNPSALTYHYRMDSMRRILRVLLRALTDLRPLLFYDYLQNTGIFYHPLDASLSSALCLLGPLIRSNSSKSSSSSKSSKTDKTALSLFDQFIQASSSSSSSSSSSFPTPIDIFLQHLHLPLSLILETALRLQKPQTALLWIHSVSSSFSSSFPSNTLHSLNTMIAHTSMLPWALSQESDDDDDDDDDEKEKRGRRRGKESESKRRCTAGLKETKSVTTQSKYKRDISTATTMSTTTTMNTMSTVSTSPSTLLPDLAYDHLSVHQQKSLLNNQIVNSYLQAGNPFAAMAVTQTGQLAQQLLIRSATRRPNLEANIYE